MPHMTDAAPMTPTQATDHSSEMAHVPQTSSPEGMMQHQSFQALHNETLQTHIDMGGSHNEPGTALALIVAIHI